MKNIYKMFLAITVLVLASLACQAVTSPKSDNPPANDEPQGSDNVIFSDDFSSAQWGTGTDADSAIEYVNGALNFNIFTENYFAWSTPNAETYQDIHMEVTLINNDTHPTTAFGLVCNKATGDNFYYVAMTPAGQYAIALAKEGETDLFLTNNDLWADSDLIAVDADSYRIGMDCGNGRLTLYVDGQQIASVADATYTSGGVAVLAWSGEDTGVTTNVSFDDFVITELP